MDPIWYILGALALVLVIAGAAAIAYALAHDVGARQAAGAALRAAQVAASAYLTTHPLDEADLQALVDRAWATLPPRVQDSYSRTQIDHDLVPILFQLEEALRTPPPAGSGPPARSPYTGPDDYTPAAPA